jgi:hypothetical protein
VREIKCLAVRRGVGLHQSQNEVASDHVLQTVDLQRDLVSVSTASGARRDVGLLTSSHDDGGQVCLTKRFNSSDPG